VVIGDKGFGKSNLVAALILYAAGAPLQSVVIIDSKPHPDEWMGEYARRYGYIVTSDPAALSVFPRVVFQVDPRALEDRAGWARPGTIGWQWTEALQRIFNRGNTFIVFDEALQTMPVSRPHPEARRLVSQARVHRLTIAVCSQSVNYFDLHVLRLAEHCAAFRMDSADDRGYLSRYRAGAQTELLGSLPTWHYGWQSKPGPFVACRPVPLVLGKSIEISRPLPATAVKETEPVAE
jgi:hypothetical protein